MFEKKYKICYDKQSVSSKSDYGVSTENVLWVEGE